MWQRCVWHNEPERWRTDGALLSATTGANTDFWRETHYGYHHDNGHFFGLKVEGDFTATLRIRGEYGKLYDQAGLMLRTAGGDWVKFGVELWEGRAVYGSVLTLGRSDWAVGPEAPNRAFHARATLRNGALRLDVSEDGRGWTLLRIAPFPDASTCLVGPMCCSPLRAGLEVAFDAFAVGPAEELG